MSITPEAFLKSLKGTHDWKEQSEWIELWAASGEVGQLWDIAQLLESPRSSSLSPLVREAIFDRIETALAVTPDLPCATMLFRLAALPRRHTVQPWRTRPEAWRQAHLATLLASGQKAETLAALFARETDGPDQQDLLACLAQEMVVRQMPLGGTVVSGFFGAHVGKASQPLTWLPLALISGENELARHLPQRTFRGSSCALPFGPSSPEERHARPQPTGDARIAAMEVIQSTTSPTEAVANWLQESNGQAESRLFVLDRPVEPTEISVTTFAGLGLECLKGATVEKIHLRRVALAEVLNLLFSAAANGGAYNSGHFAAFGRLEAWRSIAGLIGSPEGTSFQEVAALAEQCPWFLFDAASDWFYQVAWDVGVSVLRTDGRSLAVMAASDTD